MEKEVSGGGELSRGNYTLEEFARIRMLSYSFLFVLLSLCRLNFIRGDVKGNWPWEKFYEVADV